MNPDDRDNHLRPEKVVWNIEIRTAAPCNTFHTENLMLVRCPDASSRWMVLQPATRTETNLPYAGSSIRKQD